LRTQAERAKGVLPASTGLPSIETDRLSGEVHSAANERYVAGRRACDPSFLGRASELGIVRGALESARAGQGGVVLVAGEPGIGKTRFAERVAHEALAVGTKVLWGRCWDGHGAPPFWPWIQVLRGCKSLASGAEEPTIRFPEIGNVLQELGIRVPPLVSPDSEPLRFWLFDVIAVVLRRAARDAALLIIVDDLQWADPPSLLLFQFLAAELNLSHVLIMATYRDVAVTSDTALAQLLANVCRHRWTWRLSLQGLSESEVGQFIECVTGARPTDRIANLLTGLTGGNPFFLTETVRLLGSEGCARAEEDASILATLPETVRDAVDRRLRILPAESLKVLRHASIIGQDFDIFLLAAYIGWSVDEVRNALEPAINAKLVFAMLDPREQFRFAHALVREFIYGRIPICEREVWHAQVAAALERTDELETELPLATIADHYVRARRAADPLKAFGYSIRAAEQAVAAFAYEAGVTHYERARDCAAAAGIDTARRCELLLCLGDAQKRSGDWRRSRETFGRAAYLARRTGNSQFLARAAVGFSGLTARAPVDHEAVGLLREALAAAENPSARVRLLGALAFTLHFDPDPTERIGLSAQALDIARSLDETALLGDALEARMNVMLGRCHADEFIRLASEAIALAERGSNWSLAFRCRTLRYAALLQIGLAREAEAEFHGCVRLGAELRYPKYLWQVAVIKATRSITEGQFAAAERLIDEACTIGQRVDAQVADPYRILQQITLLYLRGEISSAEPALRALVAEYPDVALTHAVLATSCVASGSVSKARDALSWFEWAELRAVPGFFGLFTFSFMAEAAALSGDEARARVIYWLLTPYAQEHAAMGWGGGMLGSISHYLGLLAGVYNQFSDASRHFEDALAMNRRMNAPALVAITQRRYAEMLLKRNHRGDYSYAKDMLQKANTTFESLQMNGHRDATCAILSYYLSTSGSSERMRVADDRAGVLASDPTPSCSAVSADGSMECVFRRETDYWTIAFEGRVIRLRNTRGLQLLSLLLRCPDTDQHVFDLISAVDGYGASEIRGTFRSSGLQGPQRTSSDAGPLIDARAREEYRHRAEELATELAEAERFNDLGRVSTLRAELERVAGELNRVYGRGGRGRRTTSASERARVNVRNNICNALAILKRSDVGLWRHFKAAVRTGTFCSYRPERPIRWRF